jgi:hypothetical protein
MENMFWEIGWRSILSSLSFLRKPLSSSLLRFSRDGKTKIISSLTSLFKCDNNGINKFFSANFKLSNCAASAASACGFLLDVASMGPRATGDGWFS